MVKLGLVDVWFLWKTAKLIFAAAVDWMLGRGLCDFCLWYLFNSILYLS
jgi:hypothetical protein